MRIISPIKDNFVIQYGEEFSFVGESFSSDIDIRIKNLSTKEEFFADTKRNGSKFIASFTINKPSNDKYMCCCKDGDGEVLLGPFYSGELYLAIGQSNLSLTTKCIIGGEKQATIAKNNNLFVFNIGEADITKEGYINRPYLPQEAINENFSFKKMTEGIALNSSAISIVFLNERRKKVDYPLGIINVSMGGISIDAFLPRETVQNNEFLSAYLHKQNKNIDDELSWNKQNKGNYTQVAGFFNEKIAPLKGFKFKSIIYYQGENSCFDYESASFFKEALKTLISAYREHFNQPKLPFLLCGIAGEYYPYGDSFGIFYIQEVLSSINTPYAFYVPVFDIDPIWLKKDGNQFDHPIHTVNKIPLGERLAFTLLNNEQGRSFSFPRVSKTRTNERCIILDISLHGNGFEFGKEFFGFAIASEKGSFHLAKATAINKNQIKLESEYVDNPTKWTYGFTHYSYLCDCKTIEGYPLSPSRNFEGPVNRDEFALDIIPCSCGFLEVRENNFGVSIGGGFPIKLFDTGDTCNSIGNVSLTKNGIRYITSLNQDTFYYSSLKIRFGISGVFHRLHSYYYLCLKLSCDKEIDLVGLSFRLAGNIYGFKTVEGSNTTLNKQTKSFYVDLRNIYDGSEGLINIPRCKIKDVCDFELRFHSRNDVSNAIIILEKMEVLDVIKDDVAATPLKTENNDTSTFLPNKGK